MNTNTVAGFIGGTGILQLPLQTLAVTTETELNYTTIGSTTAIAVLSMPLLGDIRGAATQFDPASNAASPVRTGTRYGNQFFSANNTDMITSGGPFLVRIAGLITPVSNAANSLNVILYNGTTKAGTAIASTGVQTGTQSSTQAGAFLLEAQLVWDSTSQRLDGQYWYKYAGGATPFYNTWKTLSAAATSVTAAKLQFVVSVTWGNAVGGTFQPSEFSISRL